MESLSGVARQVADNAEYVTRLRVAGRTKQAVAFRRSAGLGTELLEAGRRLDVVAMNRLASLAQTA